MQAAAAGPHAAAALRAARDVSQDAATRVKRQRVGNDNSIRDSGWLPSLRMRSCQPPSHHDGVGHLDTSSSPKTSARLPWLARPRASARFKAHASPLGTTCSENTCATQAASATRDAANDSLQRCERPERGLMKAVDTAHGSHEASARLSSQPDVAAAQNATLRRAPAASFTSAPRDAASSAWEAVRAASDADASGSSTAGVVPAAALSRKPAAVFSTAPRWTHAQCEPSQRQQAATGGEYGALFCVWSRCMPGDLRMLMHHSSASLDARKHAHAM